MKRAIQLLLVTVFDLLFFSIIPVAIIISLWASVANIQSASTLTDPTHWYFRLRSFVIFHFYPFEVWSAYFLLPAVIPFIIGFLLLIFSIGILIGKKEFRLFFFATILISSTLEVFALIFSFLNTYTNTLINMVSFTDFPGLRLLGDMFEATFSVLLRVAIVVCNYLVLFPLKPGKNSPMEPSRELISDSQSEREPIN
jgi:hypothetical protein